MLHQTRTWLFAALCLAVSAAQSNAADPRPNVLFLFADDLGCGDLACYGATDIRTPHIDRLAAEGVRFTQHYSNGPECTPTRTGLMTGRYQQRAGGLECAIGTGNVGRYDDAERLAAEAQLGLPPQQAILPSTFDRAGYASGIFGKWHLGYEPYFNPLDSGFDRFFGCLGGYVDYFTHRELSPLDVLMADRQPTQRDGYMTRLIADDAERFVRQHHAEPFFCYVPFTAPHFPFQGPDDRSYEMTDATLTVGNRQTYADMVAELDRQVGRLVALLDELQLADNTIVVFASDNGAMAPGSNLPFRDTKGTVFEGGIRVPLIVRWPGHLQEGQKCDQPCMTMDLTASLVRIAGVEPPADHRLDGIDILRHVEQGTPDFDRTLFWRYKRGARTEWAVRDGALKYLRRQLDDGTMQEYLFDLAVDPGEQRDLLKERRDDASRLQSLLADWEHDVQPVR